MFKSINHFYLSLPMPSKIASKVWTQQTAHIEELSSAEFWTGWISQIAALIY